MRNVTQGPLYVIKNSLISNQNSNRIVTSLLLDNQWKNPAVSLQQLTRMPVPLPIELTEDLTCSSCSHLISVGPVTKTSSGYQCGRCPGDNGEKNFLYETLARGFLFPCKYKNVGCDVWLPFGIKMKAHEISCGRKPYICPTVPLEQCEWQGQFEEIEEHFRNSHGELVLEELKVEVNLKGKTENRYVYFCEGRALFLVDLIYYEGKGLSVELMRVLTDEKDVTFGDKYEIVLNSHHNGGKITFARNISNYVLNSNFLKVANDLIDSSLLNYVGRYDDKVTINFELETPKVPSLTSQESIVDISVNNYVFYPCKNRVYGCGYMNYYPETQKHESTCVTYECPLKSQKCEWRGLMERLESHCLKNHEVAINTLVVDLKQITPNGKNTFFFLLKSMTYGLFRVCIRLESYEGIDTLMHTVVQYIGESEEAKNCIFDIKFHDSSVTNKKSFACGCLTTDDEAFEYCAHFYYDRLKESKASFTVRKRNP